MTPSVSIIIPVLNEVATVTDCLQTLQSLFASDAKVTLEIIVVDGGSSDATVELATPLADQLIVAGQGRAGQMNAGAKASSGEYVLFLHADTRLPDDILAVLASWQNTELPLWGFFLVQLSGSARPLRIVETMMNWRSRLTGIGTGDQCLFVNRQLFNSIGGFADMPLMEDIEICQRLKRMNKPRVEIHPVVTSSRKWEREGVFKTIVLMWRLRLAYFFGAKPEELARKYYSS